MRFFLLAAAVCGVVAASSVARAETPIPDYRFSDAPYPLYPAPRRVLKCGVYEDFYGQAIQRCDWVRAR